MPNKKSPGNDKIIKDIYKAFWDGLRTPLQVFFKISFFKPFTVEELSTSQKQAVVKLIEKRTYIKNLLKIENLFHFLTLTQN